jgi:hypothetical protein
MQTASINKTLLKVEHMKLVIVGSFCNFRPDPRNASIYIKLHVRMYGCPTLLKYQKWLPFDRDQIFFTVTGKKFNRYPKRRR